MRVIVFGATGMLGAGVLRECLLADDVQQVLAVVRRPTGQQHPKLQELVHQDFRDFSTVADALRGFDACFFCLGISSIGLREDAYADITVGYTLAAARPLAELNPGMTFIFVSGEGADGSEQGKVMWARIKGKAENAVAKLPFKAVYVFRPGFVEPRHGITSRTRAYRIGYALMRPFMPLVRVLAGAHLTNTERLGQAMLNVARRGAPMRLLRNPDINQAAAGF